MERLPYLPSARAAAAALAQDRLATVLLGRGTAAWSAAKPAGDGLPDAAGLRAAFPPSPAFSGATAAHLAALAEVAGRLGRPVLFEAWDQADGAPAVLIRAVLMPACGADGRLEVVVTASPRAAG